MATLGYRPYDPALNAADVEALFDVDEYYPDVVRTLDGFQSPTILITGWLIVPSVLLTAATSLQQLLTRELAKPGSRVFILWNTNFNGLPFPGLARTVREFHAAVVKASGAAPERLKILLSTNLEFDLPGTGWGPIDWFLLSLLKLATQGKVPSDLAALGQQFWLESFPSDPQSFKNLAVFTLGSHHQKTFVAVGKRPDGKRAIHGYCAGIDFSTGPAGYGAGVYHGGSWWHDAALRVRGANAIGLLRNFVARWNHDLATFRDGKTLAHGVSASDDLAVGSLTEEVDMMTGSPGRVDTTPTIPVGGIDWLGLGETRETWVLESYRIWIKRAEERIFIANQYVRHQEIADLLLAQLEKERGLRLTIVMPMYAEEVGKRADLVKLRERFARRGASEEERRALLATIREKALTIDPFNKLTLFVQARCLSSLVAHERVQVWIPRPTQGIPYVHAKMMLVDAQALLIGSANLNGRSLLGQADSELNLVLTDATQVARIRDRHGWHREPASEAAPEYTGSWYAQHKLVRYWKEHWQVDEAYGAFPRGKDALIRYFEAIQLDGRLDVLKLDKAKFVANLDALFTEMRRRFPLVDPETLDLGALMASAGAHLI